LTLFFLALSSSNSKNENDAADELIRSLQRDICAPAGVFLFLVFIPVITVTSYLAKTADMTPKKVKPVLVIKGDIDHAP